MYSLIHSNLSFLIHEVMQQQQQQRANTQRIVHMRRAADEQI